MVEKQTEARMTDHFPGTGNMVDRAAVLRALADRVEAGESGKAVDRKVARVFGWFRVEPRFGIGGKRGGWIAPEDFLGADPDGRPRLDSLHGTTIHADVPDFTTSLDATEALREAILPGCDIVVQSAGGGHGWYVKIAAPLKHSCDETHALTELRARLAAILRAKAVEMEHG